jgi:ribosomal protein L28
MMGREAGKKGQRYWRPALTRCRLILQSHDRELLVEVSGSYLLSAYSLQFIDDGNWFGYIFRCIQDLK